MMKKRIFVIVGLLVILSLVLSLSLPVNIMGAVSQPYTWKNVKIEGGGGFIPGIIFSTAQQNLVYVRTDMGGAYRSTDGGNTWTQLMNWVSYDEWGLAGVDSIAADPVDPNRVYMQCGMYVNSWDPNNGAVLRSTDKGNTWQKTSLPFKVGGNMPGRNMGERLAVDPNKNSILFMGTRCKNGLWKSTDYGVTWSKVTSFTAVGTYVQQAGDPYLGYEPGIAWVVFDKNSGTPGNATPVIYVGVADLGNCIYRSTDGGATWSAVPGQPTGLLPQRGKLASNGVLYISYSITQGPYDGDSGDVWKLDTTTGVWTKISPIPGDDSKGDCYFGYGGLAVDAADPNTVMVASLSSWWPDCFIWRSTDAGATWSPIWTYDNTRTNKYTMDYSSAPWLTFGVNPSLPETSPKLGWMVGSLEIDPFNSNKMMYGTGATIWGIDNLNNWDAGTMTVKVKAIGIEETSVLCLVSPPTGPNLVSAIGDISGFRHLDLTKAPSFMYTQPTLSSNTCIDFAENNLQFWVRCGNVDKQWNANTNRTGFSYDGGSSWFQGNSEPSGMPSNGGGGTIAANADGTAVVYAPESTSVQVCYSTNNGNSWTPVQGGVPNGAKVRSDRVNPNYFYAFKDGAFYTSSNKGVSFTKSAATGLPTEGTGNFKTVFGKEGHIWIASGSKDSGIYGLWRSTDYGVTFTKLANVQEADAVGFGMAEPGASYPAIFVQAKIDNVRGFFRSDDEGATWVRINDDANQFGNANADITGDRRIYGRVYIATNGFGIKWGDPSGPTPTPVRGTPTPTRRTVTNTPTPTVRVNTPTPTTRVNTPTPTRRVTPTPTVRVNTPTPTPTTRVNTPTPTQGNGGYAVEYVIASDWGAGATINITIINNTTATVNGWTLAFTFPGNQTIANLWGGNHIQNGASVSIVDAGYNATIGANGGSINFGFNINYSGTNAEPTNFTLNGTACQVQ